MPPVNGHVSLAFKEHILTLWQSRDQEQGAGDAISTILRIMVLFWMQVVREAGAAAREEDLMGRPGDRVGAGCRAEMAPRAGMAGATQAMAGAVGIP